MSDVLSFLHEVAHRVSATFTPMEMEDVALFLRGDSWVLVTTPAATSASGEAGTSVQSTKHATSSHQEAAGDAALTRTHASLPPNPPSSSSSSSTALRYPLGATRWGRFIPLAIASSALVSAATAGGRSALTDYFESGGFSHVVSVNLVPTEHHSNSQQQQMMGVGLSSAVGGANGAETARLSSPAFAGLSSARGVAARKRTRLGERIGQGGNGSRDGTAAAAAAAAAVVDVMLHVRCGATAQDARQACADAVRSWYESLEDSLRGTGRRAAGDDGEKKEEAPNTFITGTGNGMSVGGSADRERVHTLHRLLILVRCCADNRSIVSTRVAGSGHNHHSSSSGAATHGGAFSSSSPSSSGSHGRRPHRNGEDPLVLLLHDIAALTTLYEARLASLRCTVRPAVLLLPEDESYGGALLQRQLKEEVGYRYWVQLFLPADEQSTQRGAAAASATVIRKEGWTAATMGRSAALRGGAAAQAESALMRGCRLAAFWGVLDASVLAASKNTMDTASNTSSDRTRVTSAPAKEEEENAHSPSSPSPKLPLEEQEGSAQRAAPFTLSHVPAEKLEDALRRHPSCFFLRPSNAPLCLFLAESLRRFPLLAPEAMWTHWQTTWTARHALMDVLFAFHTAVCPFTVSAVSVEPTATRGEEEESRRDEKGKAGVSADETPATAAAATAAATAAQFSDSQRRRDAMDLLDALLDAAFTLAEDRDSVQPLSAAAFDMERATLFCLLYDAAVHRREGRLRRIPAVVSLLLRLYERHITPDSVSACSATSRAAAHALPSVDERVRYAVQHLLPFCPLNTFYRAVEHSHRSATAGTARGATTTTSSSASASSLAGRRVVVSYPMNSLVLPLRRLSVAAQLRSAIMLALLPPDASLLELRGVAEQLYEHALPRRWRALQLLAAESAAKRKEKSEGEREALYAALQGDAVQLSAENFFHPRVPHAVRVLYLLTAHALHAPTEAAKHVPVVQLQTVCQLSDEQTLLALQELQAAGLASANLKTQTARTLLDSV